MLKNIRMYFHSTLSIILSFEAIFTLFLFAGRFKGDSRFEWVPVDITLLFLVLSLISGLYVLVKRGFRINKKSLSYFAMFMIFAIYMLLSTLWTISSVYATEKTMLFLGLVTWIFFATSNIISTDVTRVKRFLFCVIVFGMWMLIESFISIAGSFSGSFVNVLGGNYLGVGRILGFMSSILLSYLLFGKVANKTRIALSFILALTVYIMFSVGARGPFLALMIAFLPSVYYLFVFRKDAILVGKKIKLLFSFFTVIIGYLIYIFTTGKIPSTIRRILVIFEQENMGASAGARFEHYQLGIQLWLEKIFIGHGIGSWSLLSSGIDVRGYPHNIIVEILVELGIFGLLLFILIHVNAIRLLHVANKLRDPVAIAITGSLLFFFVNALVSGDLNDNRYYFAVLGLIPVCRLLLKDAKSRRIGDGNRK